MKKWLGLFRCNEMGAISVDWVVITGLVIALTLSVASALSPGLEKRGTDMVSQVSIKTNF